MTVAVVTGANRGIGLEVCRQLAELGTTVVLTARSLDKGRAAAAGLAGDVQAFALDVSDRSSIARFASDVGPVDVLVNNAAINYDTWERATTVDLDFVRSTLETNLFGAWQLTQALLPALRASRHGRIVNVSSGAGSLTEMGGGGTPAYSLSKAALNATTRMLAAELRSDRILVNAVCPGWVATDMGGAGGRPVSEGAAGIVWAATLPDEGPTGGFFRDRRPVPW
jgi:NAD(P)-dependent dehydrogenase (short-subunit alcohol dehydrogenase family)